MLAGEPFLVACQLAPSKYSETGAHCKLADRRTTAGVAAALIHPIHIGGGGEAGGFGAFRNGWTNISNCIINLLIYVGVLRPLE